MFCSFLKLEQKIEVPYISYLFLHFFFLHAFLLGEKKGIYVLYVKTVGNVILNESRLGLSP
jgi:hypothetical protein